MKTKIILLFTLFAFTLSAQIPKLITENESEMRLIADTFALNAKRTYVYKTNKYDANQRMFAYYYENKEDSTMMISVYFRTKIIGANPALEIKGTTQYVFYVALGRYLDLFPYWKKYINPTADITASSTTQNSRSLKGDYFMFKDYENNNWKLSMN